MMVIRDLLLHCLFIGAVASEFSLMEYRGDFRTQAALIFENCGNNYENVIFYDEFNELSPIFFQQLHDKFHSITLYNGKFDYKKNIEHVKKVDVIIITILSRSSLSKVFKEMNKAVWWDVLTPLYILNVKGTNCKFATNTLGLLDKNVLTSYFPCIDANNGIQIYTSNRFARRASSGWIREISRKSATYYRRQYDPKTICREFHFDRIEKLDKYNVEITLPSEVDHKSCRYEYSIDAKPLNNIGCLMKRYRKILDALTTRLNVTIDLRTINTIKLKKKLNLTYKEGKDNGKLMKELESDIRHLILYNVGLKFSGNGSLYKETYPLAWEAIGIASYNHGYKTIGEKIWDFYGIWTILFTIMVLMVTFIVIRFSESRRTAFAIFEVIRLLISHNLHTRMNTFPIRIFFITVLIYFLIIQATFSGHLAKFLTHPELREQVETMDDLERLGHTTSELSFPTNVSENFGKMYAQKKYNPNRVKKCLYRTLLRDPPNVCVYNHATLLWYSRRNKNLYVSKKSFTEKYYSYLMRRNWPLVNRVNSFFMSLEDFGFRQLWSHDNLIHSLIDKITVTTAISDEDFHPITLENLMFSFWILTIGLTSATISFCVEVFLTDKSKWSVIPFMKNIKDRTLEMVARIKILWPRHFVVFFRKK